NFLAHLQAIGLKDVSLLAICIAQQRDARGTIRIVFDRCDGCRDSLLVALEVDQAQLALVAAAPEPARDIARVAASASARLRLKQRLMRLGRGQVIVDQRRPVAQRLRRRSISLDCHKCSQLSAVSSQLVSSYSQPTPLLKADG